MEYWEEWQKSELRRIERKGMEMKPGCEYIEDYLLVSRYGIGILDEDNKRVEAFKLIEDFVDKIQEKVNG